MALQKQVIEVPFARGQNEKSDPRWVPVGEQTSVLNGKWTKTGSLRKRYGSTFIQGVSTLGFGLTVGSYKNGVVASDGTNIYSLTNINPVLGSTTLVNKDLLPECVATRESIAQFPSSATSYDVAYTNGYTCFTFRANNASGIATIYVSVKNNRDGSYKYANLPLYGGAGSGARVVSLGTDFWVFWTDSTGMKIQASRCQTNGAFTWGAPITLIVNKKVTAPAAWDVATVGTGASAAFWVVYETSFPVDNIALQKYDNTGTNITFITFDSAGSVYPITAFALRATTNETMWLAYTIPNGGGASEYTRCVGMDPSSGAITVTDTLIIDDANLPAEIFLTVERINPTTCVVAVSGVGLPGPSVVHWRQFNTSAALVGAAHTLRKYLLKSRAQLALNGICYALVQSDDQTLQLIDMIVSDTDGASQRMPRPVATLAPRAADSFGITWGLPSLITTGTTFYITVCSVDVSTSSVGVHGAYFDFASLQINQTVELGESLYIAGGMLSVFDGVTVAEHGFLSPPTFSTASAGAGGSVDVGEHQYALVFKWVNTRGELQRSAPTFTGQVTTTGGNQTVTITAYPDGLTVKQDPENQWSPAITFDVYRNTIADPATFWKLAASPNEPSNTPWTSGASVTITDNISDLTLTTNAYGILYTEGNVLSDECPPSLTCLCVHKNRLFGVGDDGYTLWFTKQWVPGFTPGFNDQLTLTVPDKGGPVTGLASLDDRLVVFKRDRIFFLYGSGPDITGNQSDFSDFIRVASDSGCTYHRSIVVGSAGVYFLSPQGLYLLSRAGEAIYIGKPVENTVAANTVCTAADIVASQGEIRWCLSATAGASLGVVVVYDYIQDSWSVSNYNDGHVPVPNSAVPASACVNDTWYWLSPIGNLYFEDKTTWLDGGQWTTLQAETAWIKANGIAGWGRFWRGTLSMEQGSPFSFTFEVATNYSDSYSQSAAFSSATISSWTTAKPIATVMIADQRTEAVRFRFTDGAPTGGSGTGEGVRFLGANCEVGLKPGTKGTRLPAAQRG